MRTTVTLIVLRALWRLFQLTVALLALPLLLIVGLYGVAVFFQVLFELACKCVPRRRLA